MHNCWTYADSGGVKDKTPHFCVKRSTLMLVCRSEGTHLEQAYLKGACGQAHGDLVAALGASERHSCLASKAQGNNLVCRKLPAELACHHSTVAVSYRPHNILFSLLVCVVLPRSQQADLWPVHVCNIAADASGRQRQRHIHSLRHYGLQTADKPANS